MRNKIRIIDLFAGLGGIRLGVEQAFAQAGIEVECLLTSEIKPYAVKTLTHNFSNENFVGDVTQVLTEDIPDFDFLLAGFPCQPFSASGKRFGFSDTRGTLFFEIERILKEKKPYGFILENVEGLVRHDIENKSDKIGRTLKTILHNLKELGYEVTYKVLDSANFGVAQSRKRIFIVGTQKQKISLENFPISISTISEIAEEGLPTMQTDFTKKLLKNYSVEELYGKAIKDKRGGSNNIHSWDIEAKGSVSVEQKALLNKIFKERRKKKWAIEHGIKWMDGMPLTLNQIKTFSNVKDLKVKLEDLTKKGYLKFEHPKDIVIEETETGIKTYRKYKTNTAKGYNIVTGKLSFEINNILDPNDIAPTLVATDVSRIVLVDGNGVRRLTIREGLRLFGYPEWYEIPVKNAQAFDLLGNTVAVPVVRAIGERLVESYISVHRGITKSIPVYS
jgi:DNA (cytosine-5)-methyltransferase 1